jgi:MFS family permease
MTDSVLLTSLSPPRRRLAFFVLLLGALMPSLSNFIATIALPAIRDDLHTASSATSLVVSAYASAFAVFLITGGRLGDLFGRRRMYVLGMAGFTLASLGCGLAPNGTLLIVSRVLQGATAAMMAPAVLAAVRTLFPRDEVAWALNIYGTGIGVAVASGQFLGGVLLAADIWGLGWRSVFLINVPVGILAIVAGLFLVPESGGYAKPRFDVGGIVLLSIALAAVVVPFSVGREQHWSPQVLTALGLSPFLLAAFFLYERWLTRRGGMPIFDASLLRIRSFRGGLMVALLFFFTMPFYVFFSIYLQTGQGMSAFAAGLVVLPYGVANFVGPMMATRAPHHWRRHLFGVGMALEVFGYAAVAACAATQTGGIILTIVLFIGGFGQGIAMPEMINTILGDVPQSHTGLAAGIMNSTLQIGSGVSVAAIGSLFFAVLGEGSGAVAYGHAVGIAMAAQVMALGLSMLLGLRKPRR